MPSWTDKDQRQFEHIRDEQQERGVEEDRAEEIAARTVNKQRRLEGRTPNKRTQGTGNPRRRYEDRTDDELRNLARERNIAQADSLERTQLIAALRGKRRSR